MEDSANARWQSFAGFVSKVLESEDLLYEFRNAEPEARMKILAEHGVSGDDYMELKDDFHRLVEGGELFARAFW